MGNCTWFHPPTVRFMRVTLLGENIVLFLDAKGAPAALPDRCCHGIAKRQLEATTNASVAIKYNVINP